MSLESSVSDLTSAATALTAEVRGKMAGIDAAVAKAIAAVPANKKILYVHPLSGLDTNDGGPLTPLKTIDKAIAITPVGGICSVRLLADYDLAGVVSFEGTALELRSDVIGTKRTVRPGYFKDGNGVPTMAGFSLHLGSQINMRDLVVELPSSAAQVPAPTGGFNAFVKVNTTGTAPVLPVKLIDCEIKDLPGATASLCSSSASALILAVTGVIFPSGFAGRYVAGVNAGVASNTLSHVLTNIPTL